MRIISPKPGTTLSAMESSASGVLSRGERPVPPVVRMRLIPLSAHSRTAPQISSGSSGTIFLSSVTQPCAKARRSSSGPAVSTRSPRLPLSLTVSTAVLIGDHICALSETPRNPAVHTLKEVLSPCQRSRVSPLSPTARKPPSHISASGGRTTVIAPAYSSPSRFSPARANLTGISTSFMQVMPSRLVCM